MIPLRPRSLLRRLIHFRPAPRIFKLEVQEGSELAREVGEELLEKRRAPGGLFLGRFSLRDVQRFLEEEGVFPYLRQLGYNPELQDLPGEFQRWHLRLMCSDSRELLGEIVVRWSYLKPRASIPLPPTAYRFLGIEWLLLQHPRGSFPPHRLPLPGQRYPGLGLGRTMLHLLEVMAESLGADGILAVPEYLHNALLYLATTRFSFLSPQKQAEVLALSRDLSALSLGEMAWAVEAGCVEESPGCPYRWEGEEVIYPLSSGLRAYFSSREYRQEVCSSYPRYRFSLREGELRRVMAERFP